MNIRNIPEKEEVKIVKSNSFRNVTLNGFGAV